MTDSTADRKDVVCKESPLYTSKWVPMCELARHANGAIIDDYLGEGVRIPTGFKCVDTALGDGFNPGELVVLASPVGKGKTTVAINIASHVACKENIPVGYFTFADHPKSLFELMVCSRCYLTLKYLRNPCLMEDENWSKLEKQILFFEDKPFYVNAFNADPLSKCFEFCQEVSKGKPSLIVIDGWDAVEAVAEHPERLAVELKHLAVQLNCVILVTKTVKQHGVYPQLKDLEVPDPKLAALADKVFVILRDDLVRERKEIELHLVKNRTGELDTFPLKYKTNAGMIYD